MNGFSADAVADGEDLQLRFAFAGFPWPRRRLADSPPTDSESVDNGRNQPWKRLSISAQRGHVVHSTPRRSPDQPRFSEDLEMLREGRFRDVFFG